LVHDCLPPSFAGNDRRNLDSQNICFRTMIKNIKFMMGVQPDRHVGPRGESLGFNVLLTAAVRTEQEARATAEWIAQALKEKAASTPKSGLILPRSVLDLS
jgi:hypothetical protein